ncbi:hypothetical protein COBT_002053 [Conglomerata obtusa]
MKKTSYKIQFYGLATEEDLCSTYIKHLTSFEILKSGPPESNFNNLKCILDAALKFNVDFVWPGWGYLSENYELPKMLKLNKIGFIGPSDDAMLALGNKCNSVRVCRALNIPTIPTMTLDLNKIVEFLNEIHGEQIDALDVAYNDMILKVNELKTKKELRICKSDCNKISNEDKSSVKSKILEISDTHRNNVINKEENRKYNLDFDEITDKCEFNIDKAKLHDKNASTNGLEQNYILELKLLIRKYGFPLIIKSSNSGGGKGINVIKDIKELTESFDMLKKESNVDVMICQLIEKARHVELQMAADNYNNVICLGARDCTIQRRYQKLVEESITTSCFKIYKKMEEDAIAILKKVKYKGVATVEFLVKDDEYYFLEVNTRLQVEHPVSELKSNLNIPKIQFMIAKGKRIDNIRINESKKHVLGMRIVAEDVKQKFLPVSGCFKIYIPLEPKVFGYFTTLSGVINNYGDSQFGHIFVKAKTRKKCILRMKKFLKNILITGICTNIEFMISLLDNNIFIKNLFNTKTIDDFINQNLLNDGYIVRSLDCTKNNVYLNDTTNSITKCTEPSIQPILLYAVVYSINSKSNVNRIEFVYNKEKYLISSYRVSKDAYLFEMNGSFSKLEIYVKNDLIYIFEVDLCAIVEYRIDDCKYCIFNNNKIFEFYKHSNDTTIITPTDGKIIGFFKQNGELINQNENFVEIEIMKVRMILVSQHSGYIQLKKEINNFVRCGETIAIIITDSNKNIQHNQNIFVKECYLKSCFNEKQIDKTAVIIKNIFFGFELPFELLKTFQNAEISDGNLLLSFMQSFYNCKTKTPDIYRFIEDVTCKLYSLVKQNLNFKPCVPFIELLELFDSIIIEKTLPNKIFENVVNLKNTFSAYKFKKKNFYMCKNITEKNFKDYLARNCNYKEGVLFAIKFVEEKSNILIEKYLENIFGQKYTDVQYKNIKHGVEFNFKTESRDVNGMFYICNVDCEEIHSSSNDQIILHYNCVNIKQKNQIYIEVNETAPFIVYHYNNTRYLCDSIISDVILFQKFTGKNLIFKDIFRNMRIYLIKESLEIIYTIDTHSGNAIMDVKYISHAIKQILASIIITYKKYNVSKSHLIIEIEGITKINKSIVSGIADDCIFYYAKDYINNGVLKCCIFFKNDYNNKIEFSVIRGFLEKKVYYNEILVEYSIENRTLYVNDNFCEGTCTDLNKLLNESNEVFGREIARKLNTVIVDDMLFLIKLYFIINNYTYSIKEIFIARNTCQKQENFLRHNEFFYHLTNVNEFKIGTRGFMIDYNDKIIIAFMNDIVHKNGSFSILEDIYYTLLLREAKNLGIPFINISCNSGARIGLFDDILYNITYNNNKFYTNAVEGVLIDDSKILSIHGNIETGPENLSFSGLIAKETCEAYKQIFTLSYVTGMSVGIGAYINKLGQRIIQKSSSSILLTGYQALNTLLQSKIYKSNQEIGGEKIMKENGNSHLVVHTDFEGIEEIFNWLNYYFHSRCYKKMETGIGNSSKFIRQNKITQEKESKFLGYYKNQCVYNEVMNEREIIELIFDKGQIREYQKSFGSNIIVGRGYINGTSLGIISTENEHTEKTKNVLLVDSSKKIAQAISDFDKEGLDILILASFKGFSGGHKEMQDNILDAGSNIVKQLSKCKTRVLVYIIPGGEIRGGSWVVFDKNINPNIVIASHPRADVGIIQPDGICKLKFKEKTRKEIFLKNNLNYTDASGLKMAVDFCKLHDSCFRMYINGMIDDLVSLDELREYITSNLLT